MTGITRPQQITIIGGGFTGAILAAHAVRASRHALAITVVEPQSEVGRGVAYGTRDPAHRINVPSQRMVVSQDDPEAATRWFFAQGLLPDPKSEDAQGHFYVSRHAYGSFVQDFLLRTLEAAGDRVAFRHEQAAATAVHRSEDGWRVELRSGATLTADIVALCFGHSAPALPCPVTTDALAHPKFVANPWADDALASIEQNDSVLIAGTGLTMADTVTSLLERGHRGPITAVSRRGLLPRTHGLFINDLDIFEGAPVPTTALALLQLARRAIRRNSAVGWHPAADAIRINLPLLWSALPAREKQRVVRRLLPFWEVHRFRIAPQIDGALATARRAAQLTVVPAALVNVDRREGRFAATLRQAGGDVRERVYDSVVLCTGPQKDVRANSLVANLVAEGVARVDDVGVGLAVDRQSHVIDEAGRSQDSFLAFGPITRGTFGEMTGAPDIARHIETVAKTLFGTAHYGLEGSDPQQVSQVTRQFI